MRFSLNNHSLISEMILRLALPLGVLALALMITLGMLSAQRERAAIGESLIRSVTRITAFVENKLSERVADLDLMADHSSLVEKPDLNEFRRIFDMLQNRHPGFIWIGRTDTQGQVLAASNGLLEGHSISHQAVFREGRKGLFLGDVHEAVLPVPESYRTLSHQVIDLSRPIYGPDDSIQGVLATHISWPWLQDFFEQTLTENDHARRLELMVIDRENRILAGPAHLLGQPFGPAAAVTRTGTGRAHWQEAEWSGESHHLFAWVDLRQSSLISALGWRVIVRLPSEVALAPIRQLHLQLAGSALLLILGVGLLAWIQARQISRPLAEIVSAADAITAGAEPNIPASTSHVREVRKLAAALQHMLDTLTHRDQALSDMELLAHRDSLTGLHNRRALELHMELSAEHTQRNQEGLAVLAMDLDGFKAVNDTHGHATGDALLREVAARMQNVVRSGEMLARLGGDEFILLIVSPQNTLEHDTQAVAERILACFEHEFFAAGHPVRVGCSLGGALGKPGDHPQDILRRADEALYIVKRSGRGHFLWNPQNH